MSKANVPTGSRQKWILKKTNADIKLMSSILGLSEITAQVMVNRGIRTKNGAVRFLHPEMRFLHEPSGMKDMDKAVELVMACASSGGRIAIYGDYDVDGVMSTVILYKTLRRFGAEVYYYIPHREEEGYGLNKEAVHKIKEGEADLILTCDNGIAALEEVREAKKLDMRVVILDHHEPGFVEDEDYKRLDVLPEADAIVDPKQNACPYPFKQLCAAGLAYKFAAAFYARSGTPFDEGDEFLSLAAIATVCDIVDLQDENRIIVKNGLELLNRDLSRQTLPEGLAALLREKGFSSEVEPSRKKKNGSRIGVTEAGFIIGPCINATGRLESAGLAVELLITDEPERAAQLAKRMAELNDERKYMTTKSVERVLQSIETDPETEMEAPDKLDSIIVIYDEEIHESIAGIVAGRIKDSLCRPVIVLTRSGSCAKGSARSIEGYNIFEELYKHRGLYLRFGGHAMAAGLSLSVEHIPVLRQRLNSDCTLTQEDFVRTIKIDHELDFAMVTYEFAEELQRLAPFGKGNHAPLFGTRDVKIQELRNIPDKNTIIFNLVDRTGRRIKAVAFGLNERIEETAGMRIDIVYAIEINCYNGNTSVQLMIKDFRTAGAVRP